MDLSLFTAFRCTKIRNKWNYILKSLQKSCQFYPCDIGLCWRVFFKNLCTWMCLLNFKSLTFTLSNFLKIHTKFMQIGCLHVVTYVRFARFGRDVPLGSGRIHYSNFPRKSDTFLYINRFNFGPKLYSKYEAIWQKLLKVRLKWHTFLLLDSWVQTKSGLTLTFVRLGLGSNGLGTLVQWTRTHTWWTRTLAWWTRTLALWTRTHCWTHESGLTPTLTNNTSQDNQVCCRCAFNIKLCITLPHLGVPKTALLKTILDVWWLANAHASLKI